MNYKVPYNFSQARQRRMLRQTLITNQKTNENTLNTCQKRQNIMPEHIPEKPSEKTPATNQDTNEQIKTKNSTYSKFAPEALPKVPDL